jgi:hypothetical protein
VKALCGSMHRAFLVAVTEWLYSNNYSIKVGGFKGDILPPTLLIPKKRNYFAI